MTPELAAIKDFLEREHLVHETGREAIYELPVSERVASGTAIDEVYFVSEERLKDRTLYVFACRRNDSRFRPGTRLRLSRGDPRATAARLELVDDHFDGKKYTLRLSGPGYGPETFASSEPWVLDEDIFDLLETQLEVLRRAEQAGLDAWLKGREPPDADSRPCDSEFAQDLSGSLLKAFAAAVKARNYLAIQGPPGSGKTHLLARLALHFALREDARVLITAVSHQAIHQALGETYWVAHNRSADHPGLSGLLSDGLCKFGASKGANEGLPEGIRAVARPPANQRPLICGATLYAALHALSAQSGSKPKRRPFDAILFDEAGQAPLVLALAARLLAPKVVFIGDDAQLPPVVELPPEEGEASSRASVLEFIRRRYQAPLLLTETRRLNRELCAAVSECFYGGRLKPTPEAEGRVLKLRGEVSERYGEILGPEHSLVFVDVPHRDGRSTSAPEALWAAGIVREALRLGLAAEEIGVVAPYRAQCNRIRFLLGKVGGLLCATVERFQGQERELVVISLTSSKPAYLARLASFLFNPNRLNVAVSRARTKVVLLGAKEALTQTAEAADPDSDSAAGLAAFTKLLSLAHLVEGSALPRLEAALEGEAAPRGEAFEPGEAVEHARYGTGRVLSKSVQLIDNKREWVNEIRFQDGVVRLLVPALSRPPMRRLN